MNLSVSTYSFQKWIDKGEITQLDCIKLVKEMGFGGIEFAGLHPHDGSGQMEYARRLARQCRELELPVVNYTVSADLLNGSGGDMAAEVERLKREVDVASVLGAKGMRHDAAWGFAEDGRRQRGFFDVLPALAEGCREVAQYAQDAHIRTMVENHGFFCQDSGRVEALVNKVGHPNFGVLIDIGNFCCVDEPSQQAVGVLAPYAFYVHAKDFHIKSGSGPYPGPTFFRSRSGNYLRGAVLGHGNIEVCQCLSVLKHSGYDGDVGIEFEGIEDARLGVELGLANLKSYLALL